jgi:hypothetical protein
VCAGGQLARWWLSLSETSSQLLGSLVDALMAEQKGASAAARFRHSS